MRRAGVRHAVIHAPGIRIFALAFVVAIALTACSSGPASTSAGGSASDGPAFAVDSEDDGFLLTWNPARGIPTEPDIEVAVDTPMDEGWRPRDGWRRIDLGDDQRRTVRFTDVEPGLRYRFRVRDDSGEWSEPVERIHAVPTLPVVRITTDDPDPVFEEDKRYLDGTFVSESGAVAEGRTEAGMRIRARGNSTLTRVPDKKSYQVDFDEKVSVLGMPKASKWILLANYLDPTQIRNWTAMRIAAASGLAWTPQSRWVELYLNGDYRGVYEVSEKIDVGRDKVDIDELTSRITGGTDITGGYLLQIEMARQPDKDTWTTPRGVHVAVQRPKRKDSNEQQFAYIRDQVDAFEAALFSENFTDPVTGYRAHLDTDSFIDLWITQETTANTDAYFDSLYFYKKRDDPKLYFGPAWDFDTSLGTRFLLFADLETPWYSAIGPREVKPGERAYDERPWVYRLFQDPWFRDRVAQRWRAVLPEIEKIPGQLDEVESELAGARANDLLRWKDTEDSVLSTHRYGDVDDADRPGFVADWLRKRIEWITENVDTAIPRLPG